MTTAVKIGLVLSISIGLSACSGGTKRGPDEFGVLPTKPLSMPKDLSILPEPNPTGRNLADQRPLADSIVALGGKSERLDQTTIFAGEAALIQAAGRYGVAENIRTVTAQEDAEYRAKNKGRVLERLAGVDTYESRLRAQRLDAYAELLRLRKRGVPTPTAPPKGR